MDEVSDTSSTPEDSEKPSQSHSAPASTQDAEPTSTSIGAQLGVAYRAPSFGESAFAMPAPNYLDVQPTSYSADDFNRSFLSDGKYNFSDPAGNHAKATFTEALSIGATAQVGLFYPILGFGPYIGINASTGITSTGESFFQAQISYGVGVGSFLGYGTSGQLNLGAALKEGWDHGAHAEFNGGLGPKSLSVPFGEQGIGASSGNYLKIHCALDMARGSLLRTSGPIHLR